MARPPALEETPPEDRVPRIAKASFGIGGLVTQFSNNLTKELVNPVFVVALHLSPTLVGLSLIIFRLYDAFADVIMGWVSDNTRTRWGRRRPWLLVGTFLCAGLLPVMWFVSRDWSPTTQIAWLIGTGIVLYTASTVYAVPYESFLLELTPSYRERTSVTSYKMVFTSLAGPLIGYSWAITQLPFFRNQATGEPDTLYGARVLTIGVGVLIVFFGLAPVFFARERFYATSKLQPKVSLKANLGATLRCRPFLVLVGVAVTGVTGTYLSNGLTFFTRLYYVCQTDTILAAKLAGVQSIVWLSVAVGSIFVYQALADRWGKTAVLYLAMALGLISVVIRWWVFRPDQPYLTLVSAALLSTSINGLWQMLSSMMADVVDADELTTRFRREGAFAAIFSWFMKVCYTVGVAFPGLIMGFAGFVVARGNEQAPDVITHLRLWDAILPACLIAVSILLLTLYPLSATRMAEIRRDLEARRGHL
jgi:GPH family glycoside/pentoside/hexuronide:cation symporter